MAGSRFIALAIASLGMVAIFSANNVRAQQPPAGSSPVIFLDVLDLPARIDEPKLVRYNDGYRLNCALANRSDESLLGVRLVLITIGRDGKLRTRLTWSEESPLAGSSIKSFELHPPIRDKLQVADRLFLVIDEVIGRETIWRTVNADTALRAYARNQHDIVPKVQALANKYDRDWGPMIAIPQEKKQ